MSLVPGRRLGHYEILAKLGEGGMGVVYKARDTDLERLVAIKVLPPGSVADPERKRRFTQEAKAASALNHPSIITIYEIARVDGTDFIAMEHVQGKTLGELIGRKGLSLKDTLSYAIQAAGALAKAHATGIVHRDLKPSNIMVTDEGLVKILDFGLAKLMSSAVDDDRHAAAETMTASAPLGTTVGGIVGTAAYMSPEQAEGRKVDARSDIFSFGAVLYEMATGIRAFQGTSTVQTLAAVVNNEPPPPGQLARDLPRDLERIILRCLRKDPGRRMQFMADLAVELEEIKVESGTHIAATQVPSRRHRTRWVIGSAAVLALAAASAWVLWPAPVTPPKVEQLTTLFGDEGFPTFSPDGNQVAFAWGGEKGDNIDIYVMPVGSATPVRLTTDAAQDSAPAWSPDGSRIAFVRRRRNEGAIYLVTPPVPNSEQKVADVRPVAVLNNDVTTVSWFPDSKRLAVTERDADGQMNGIIMISIGHDDPRRLISTPVSGGTYHYPTVSPTGDAVGYAFCHGGFSCDVHVMELARDFTPKGPPQRLTAQKSHADGIAWTPDGRALIYGSSSHLWRVSVPGGKPQRLELAGDHVRSPAVSSQGGELAYTHLGNDFDIWKFQSNGPPEDFLFSTLDDRDAQFSPDGKRIAFESRRLGRATQIWVANADGTNPKPLTEGAEGNGGSPRWSHDSRRIAFDGQEPDGRKTVYIIDAGGGQQHALTPGAMPSWSGDGKWIYFNSDSGDSSSGREEVWRIPTAGGLATQITDSGGGNAIEAPDGKTLYYRKAPAAPGVLFARSRDGGPERRVLDSMATGVNEYFPVEEGVYYVAPPDPRQPFVWELRFLNLATGKHETLNRFEARFGVGLTVAPDRSTILFSGAKASAGNDLMLIRNFR